METYVTLYGTASFNKYEFNVLDIFMYDMTLYWLHCIVKFCSMFRDYEVGFAW